MAAKLHPRDRIIANLKAHSGIDAAYIERFQDQVVVFEYLSRPNHMGGIKTVTKHPEIRTLAGGQTVSWKDVKPKMLLKHTDDLIKSKVNAERRTEVWYKLFHGLPKEARAPSWDPEAPNPYAHPSVNSLPNGKGDRYWKSPGSQLVSSEASEGTHEDPKKLDEKAASIYDKEPSLKNWREARNYLMAEDEIEAIDCDSVDFTPNLDGFWAIRDDERTEGMFGSCIHPGQKPTYEEDHVEGDMTHINHDCDQVRAMIARLVKYSGGEWTLESFRAALGGWERAKLIDFLQRRGAKAGVKLGLYQVAWEFFQKRALLGIPLPDAKTVESKKRKREPLEERAVNAIEHNAEQKREKRKAQKLADEKEMKALEEPAPAPIIDLDAD